jgi:hypothetical protein
MGEINAVHPFREGNGRVQRVFCAQLALNAGYFIDFESVLPIPNRHGPFLADVVQCQVEQFEYRTWAIWTLCATGATTKDYVRMQWTMLQQDKPQDYVIATGVQYRVRYAMLAPLRIRNVTVTACSGFRSVTGVYSNADQTYLFGARRTSGKAKVLAGAISARLCNYFC